MKLSQTVFFKIFLMSQLTRTLQTIKLLMKPPDVSQTMYSVAHYLPTIQFVTKSLFFIKKSFCCSVTPLTADSSRVHHSSPHLSFIHGITRGCFISYSLREDVSFPRITALSCSCSLRSLYFPFFILISGGC